MSSHISCHKIEKSYLDKTLFLDLSLTIDRKTKLGIVGPNGSGKSTLAKILARKDLPDEGNISFAKGLKCQLISQKEEDKTNDSVKDFILKKIADEYPDTFDQESVVNKIISQMKLSNPEQKFSELSGGQRKKLSIMSCLQTKPDLVIFDEPTNHLDLQSVVWLEGLLKGARFAWLCISHDRYFLETVAASILEINPIFEKKYYYSHNSYQEFLKEKETHLGEQAHKLQTVRTQLRKEDEWLKRSPKARTTKAQYRVDKALDLKDQYQELRGRFQEKKLDIEFSKTGSQSKKLLEIKNLCLKIADRLICKDFSTIVSNRKRIGLLGLNGSGKTTLLKFLMNQYDNYVGEIKKKNDLQEVYFDQNKSSMQTEESVKSFLSPQGDTVIYRGKPVHVNGWAERLGIHRDKMTTPVNKLSGGEQARLLIARLMLKEADLLLLDEPTNDLDIPTLEVLEESLQQFKGAVFIVSHDRYLLDKVCDSYWGFDNKGLLREYHDRSLWQQEVLGKQQTQKKEKTTVSPTPKASQKKSKKLSYNEKREWEQIEPKILVFEKEVELLKKEIEAFTGAADYLKLAALTSQYQKKQDELNQLYERWQELEDKSSP